MTLKEKNGEKLEGKATFFSGVKHYKSSSPQLIVVYINPTFAKIIDWALYRHEENMFLKSSSNIANKILILFFGGIIETFSIQICELNLFCDIFCFNIHPAHTDTDWMETPAATERFNGVSFSSTFIIVLF